MARTLQERLDAVDAAIAQIEESGQTVEANGRRRTRGDLEQLYRQRDRLEARIARQERGGMRVRRTVPLDD